MTESLHEIIWTDEVVTFWREYHPDGRQFIHIKVDKWSKDYYYHILTVWFDIQDLYGTFYAPVANEKIGHFCNMLGFEYTDEYVFYNDNIVRRVMICPGQLD